MIVMKEEHECCETIKSDLIWERKKDLFEKVMFKLRSEGWINIAQVNNVRKNISGRRNCMGEDNEAWWRLEYLKKLIKKTLESQRKMSNRWGLGGR